MIGMWVGHYGDRYVSGDNFVIGKWGVNLLIVKWVGSFWEWELGGSIL